MKRHDHAPLPAIALLVGLVLPMLVAQGARVLVTDRQSPCMIPRH